jgi:hypothetical protein
MKAAGIVSRDEVPVVPLVRQTGSTRPAVSVTAAPGISLDSLGVFLRGGERTAGYLE